LLVLGVSASVSLDLGEVVDALVTTVDFVSADTAAFTIQLNLKNKHRQLREQIEKKCLLSS